MKRVIKSFTQGAVRATVYRETEYEEYFVTLRVDGDVQHDSTYFTADRQDALDAAAAMLAAAVAT